MVEDYWLEIVQSGSEDYLPKKESLDLCFTSPPYFDTEKYSKETTQSYIKFPNKIDWLAGFLRKTIQNCAYGLKPKRHLIINIANVSSFDTLEDEMGNIILSEGFEYLDKFQLTLSKMPGKNLKSDGFKHEPVFLFRKK
jgi:DNA modification methylase